MISTRLMALIGLLVIGLINGAILARSAYNQSVSVGHLQLSLQDLHASYRAQGHLSLGFSYPQGGYGLSLSALYDLAPDCQRPCVIQGFGLFEFKGPLYRETLSRTQRGAQDREGLERLKTFNKQSRLYVASVSRTPAATPETRNTVQIPITIHYSPHGAHTTLKLVHDQLYVDHAQQQQLRECPTALIEVHWGKLSIPWLGQISCAP